MAETAVAVQKKNQPGPVAQVKAMLEQENVKSRFREVLGQKAPQFMASITNAVAASDQLKTCNANSIMAAAFVAASLDLPIDSNLGFAAIVPYKKNYKDKQTGEWMSKTLASFQMQYKGYVQLAIRTGQYEKMNCSEVYEDELVSYNPITGECEFVTDYSKCVHRTSGQTDKIVGYYAWFRLLSGFTKELYMSKAEVNNHAEKYSQSYRYDKQKNKQSSVWSTNFDAMAKKTVIKLLLSKWGIMTVEMQKAITDDQKTFDEEDDGAYGDNHPDVIEAEDPFKLEGKVVDAEDELEEIEITQ